MNKNETDAHKGGICKLNRLWRVPDGGINIMWVLKPADGNGATAGKQT